MSEPILVATGLRKTFRAARGNPAVEALRGVDLTVATGEVFGLLGPNGAGKTTAMRILCTLLIPSAGSARIAGFDLVREQAQVRQRIGYVGQKGGMEGVATGRENLILQARLYGMSRAAAAVRVDELIDRLKLAEFAGRKTQTYSGGQRRIFDLASGIIHKPPLLFLDEPTTGLDPASRARVWDEVRRLNVEGATVFLTTHYLEEADALCGHVAIMDKGAVAALGTPADLKATVGGDTIVLGFASEAAAKAAAAAVVGSPFGAKMQTHAQTVRLYVQRGEEVLPAVLQFLNAKQLEIATVTLARPSLDEVFLKLTGRSLTSEPQVGS